MSVSSFSSSSTLDQDWFNFDSTSLNMDPISFDQAELDALFPLTPTVKNPTGAAQGVSDPGMFVFRQGIGPAPGLSQGFQPVPLPLAQQPTPQFAFQNLAIPNVSQGAHYNPSVGWYFPAKIPSPTTQKPIPPFPATQQPILPNPVMHQPIIPDPVMQQPIIPDRKLITSTPAPSSNAGTFDLCSPEPESADVESAPIRKGKRKATQTFTIISEQRKTELLQVCTVQRCTCESSAPAPRPLNAFMLYRKANSAQVAAENGHRHQDVSALLGKRWKTESRDVKAKFEALAKQELKKHRRLYPGYRYNPGSRKRAHFGNQACTCGAFERNMNMLRASCSSNVLAGLEIDLATNNYDDDRRIGNDEESGSEEDTEDEIQVRRFSKRLRNASMK